MIEYKNGVFGLHGDGFSCLLRVNEHRLVELLHYGEPVATDDGEAFRCRQGLGWGSSVLRDDGDSGSCPDAMPLCYSGAGRGDYRESPLELAGSPTDFLFEGYTITEGGVPSVSGLPTPDGVSETLTLQFVQGGAELLLLFGICGGVLTRRAILKNTGQTPLTVTKLMSGMFDLFGTFEMTTFDGGWIAEMRKHTVPVTENRVVNESLTGFSSHRHHPAFLLSESGATEESGRVYGFNLMYSGNHYASACRSLQGFTRVMQGISPANFLRVVQGGECFETPEAVSCFSAAGFGGVSKTMHRFVNECVVPRGWRYTERPVVFNSWEGCMFDFDHRRLVGLAKDAAALGCELFVLDDGWFGKRNDDTAGLGDYTVNLQKLPKGLDGLARAINKAGMQFGLWFEPEAVNPDSDLFRAHPDWALTDEFAPLLARHELLLDLTKPQVRDYVVEQVGATLDSAPITYVKWDMNRHSVALGNRAHEYILGLYDVLRRIFVPRPHILLETCASGGNRFDLGMLSFGPQAWCSDNTDPVERLTIQENLSYFYPQSTFGAHVSAAPHAQTLRQTPLATRGNVSFFGCLGYELNLKHLLKHEKEEIAAQIAFYKEHRRDFQFGTFFRLENGWQVTGKNTLAAVFRKLFSAAPPFEVLRVKGLVAEKRYTFVSRPQRLRVGPFGNLLKHVVPLDPDPNGLLLRAADRWLTLPDGAQELTATGAALQAGVRLLPLFRGTGYDERQRTQTDFGSELFVIKECNENEGS